ncbi:MAG: hypothetical protein CM15mP106_1110 [Candidatus Neomarinimicrobiota bacterium]|nr:MAG: hypothetical protein CM15mP106_1110 [Candidatus Neomarinimicrobiota bacterium]
MYDAYGGLTQSVILLKFILALWVVICTEVLSMKSFSFGRECQIVFREWARHRKSLGTAIKYLHVETAGASTFLFRNNETIEIKGLKVLNLPIKPSLVISEKMPKILSLNFSIKPTLGRKLKLRKDGGTQVSTTNHNL